MGAIVCTVVLHNAHSEWAGAALGIALVLNAWLLVDLCREVAT